MLCYQSVSKSEASGTRYDTLPAVPLYWAERGAIFALVVCGMVGKNTGHKLKEGAKITT